MKSKWEAPQELFEELDDEFDFTIDVCATEETNKCERFLTPEEGLRESWLGEVCWMHPPYGRQTKVWVEKAHREWRNGATVVALLPVRTDTKWFHEYISNKVETRFIRGRLKFEGTKLPAPFASMLVIYDHPEEYEEILRVESEHDLSNEEIADMVRRTIPMGSMCSSAGEKCPFWDIDPEKPNRECGLCRLTGEKDWIPSSRSTYIGEDSHRKYHIPRLYEKIKNCDINLGSEEEL